MKLLSHRSGTRIRHLRYMEGKGPPRCLVEQVAQHIVRNRIFWWLSVVAVLSVSFQFVVDGSLHRLVFTEALPRIF